MLLRTNSYNKSGEGKKSDKIDMEKSLPLQKPKQRKTWQRFIKKRLPILEWMPKYNRLMAVSDVIAGITLGLTMVPQSLAYASLANLPVHYGLYSSFVGAFVYVFMGTVNEVSIGPTGLVSLLTLQTCRHLPVQFVTLLAFLCGCVILAMGLLRLGFLVDLISPAVTSGFTSGMAVTLIMTQVKGLLGLSFTAESAFENAQMIIKKWSKVRLNDCLLAAGCCISLLLLRKLKDIRISPNREKLKKSLWFLSISRNALVVLTATLAAYFTYSESRPLFKLTGLAKSGLPGIQVPPFSLTVGNNTLNFRDMVWEITPSIFVMPISMVLLNISIAKAFSTGGRIRATQEMLALGLCNVLGSFVQSMPTTGAFTRSVVANSSGVRSPFANFYSGMVVLLALGLMTQYFYFIPKACLSSVLICAVIFMIDYKTVIRLWHESKRELAILLVTFIASVWQSLNMAMVIGVCTNILVLLYDIMRPQTETMVVKTLAGQVITIQPTLALVYINIEQFCTRVLNAASSSSSPVLIDCTQLSLVDNSSEQALQRLTKEFRKANRPLLFYNCTEKLANRFESIEIDHSSLKCRTVEEALVGYQSTLNREETALLMCKDIEP